MQDVCERHPSRPIYNVDVDSLQLTPGGYDAIMHIFKKDPVFPSVPLDPQKCLGPVSLLPKPETAAPLGPSLFFGPCLKC